MDFKNICFFFSASGKVDSEVTGQVEQETSQNESETFTGEIQNMNITTEVCK